MAKSTAGGRHRECTRKPKIATMCFFFQQDPKYPVGVVLTLPGKGSVLVRLGVEVQALGRLGIGAHALDRLG